MLLEANMPLSKLKLYRVRLGFQSLGYFMKVKVLAYLHAAYANMEDRSLHGV